MMSVCNYRYCIVCIKAGSNELASVRALMDMSLNALIADTFEVEIDEIGNELELRNDLGMKQTEEVELKEHISEYFDGLQVDMSHMVTIGDLHELVVDHEFEDIAEDYFN
ncbi:MAG: hypothetical protein OQL19_06765 [Gammaproteobacteria bacterium]|nr:hypothetical protein [Gammaproteobacteria bacterium]